VRDRTSLQGKPGDLLALVAGASLPLAFAPFGWYPLALVSPLILFLCWHDAGPGRAAWRGWLFGLGLFGLGVSWIEISVHQFGIPVRIFSVGVTLALVMFLALYPSLAGWLAARLRPAGGGAGATHALLLLPALWVLQEWLRGWLLTGFPWLDLGYSQIDSPLGGYAPLLGVYGVSWLTALGAALLYHLLVGGQRRLGVILLLLSLWLGGWVLGQRQWSRIDDKDLHVALIQGAVPQARKWLPSELRPTQALYWRLTREHPEAELILWPETAIPAFMDRLGDYLTGIREILGRQGGTLVLGLPVRTDRGHYYNAIVALDDPAQVYYKRHLVPFGEYLPLPGLLRGPLEALDIPMSDFSAGSARQPLLHADGVTLGVSICYEDAFGSEVSQALPEAELLLNISNDAWFGDSLAPHQHLQIARMRALENGRYLLRSTNTGISAVIDPRGRVTARAPQFQPVALAAVVHRASGVTPYARYRNVPVITLMFVLLGLGILGGRGGRARGRPAPGMRGAPATRGRV